MKSKQQISERNSGNKKDNRQAAKPVAKPVQDKFSFKKHLLLQENKRYLTIALIIGIVSFVALRLLYPVPSFYSDSNTYVQAARDKQSVSFRPIEYSQLINFFKGFSTSDFALIFGQYFSNLLANLFLFFSVTYFFPLKRILKIIFFALVVANPLYVIVSNHVLTDAFFSSFTAVWFTLLIWIIYNPRWIYIVLQMIVLVILFKLRYQAIIFPFFVAVGLYFSKQQLWQKVIGGAATFLLIILLIWRTTNATESYTGTRTFSAFGGWQMANNAMYVLEHDSLDHNAVENEEAKQALIFSDKYLDTSKFAAATTITGHYMWNKESPLKKYMERVIASNRYTSYFETWTALGPVYNTMGKEVILGKPGSYFKHFVVPNTKQYFFPPLEAYETYNVGTDTVSPTIKDFYKYQTNKTGPQRAGIYAVVVKPWKHLFPVINLLFIGLGLYYLAAKKYKNQSKLFNHTLITFSLFNLGNFLFIIFLAPSVFRYNVFLITLMIPILLCLVQKCFMEKGSTNEIAMS